MKLFQCFDKGSFGDFSKFWKWVSRQRQNEAFSKVCSGSPQWLEAFWQIASICCRTCRPNSKEKSWLLEIGVSLGSGHKWPFLLLWSPFEWRNLYREWSCHCRYFDNCFYIFQCKYRVARVECTPMILISGRISEPSE